MPLAESTKWWLIRHWPWGYRRVSAVLAALSPAQRREMARATALYGPLVPARSLCFDVGANHGARTDVFRRLGARVVAVEPQPRCLERLRARFGADPGVIVVPMAVGAAPGRATLYLGGSDLISTLASDWKQEATAIPELAELGWRGEIEVEVTTLEVLIAAHGVPAFTKIDVEGFELEVLRGLRRPLPLLSLEYTLWKLEPTFACLDALAGLGTYEYNLSEMETLQLALPRWVPAAEIRAHLERHCDRREFGYGDVYARLVAAG